MLRIIHFHQTFQVPKIEVLSYISCMDTAYVREHPSPKTDENKVQYLHFIYKYLKLLVTSVAHLGEDIAPQIGTPLL